MTKQRKSTALWAGAAILSLALVAATAADAAGRGGGGGGRSGASSMNRSGGNASNRQVRSSATGNINGNNNVNRNTNVNRNSNVNVNRNVDVDVDVDHHYGWGGYYHPVARAATAAVVTAAVVGTYYRTLPTSCVTVYRGTVVYYQCSNGWYQPVYSGMTVQYVVVKAP